MRKDFIRKRLRRPTTGLALSNSQIKLSKSVEKVRGHYIYGEQLRAVLDNVVLAEYHCRYDWRTRKVTELRDGVFYPTRFASPQGALIPLTPQESLVLYRPQTRRRQAHTSLSTQQLVLFELVRTG
jgi:hypothetical protein